MLLVLDYPRREPVPEKMSAPVVAAVEALRIEPVEPVDCVRHLFSPRLDYEVVMRSVV